MKKPQAGFTIVELVVVIAVIGILAAGTIATYGLVQRDAKDTAIKTATQQVADSLKLWSTRSNLPPDGTGASNGGTGWVQTGGYTTTTIEQFLIAQGYLNTGFSSNLSSQNANSGYQYRIMMFYKCTDTSVTPNVVRYAVFASLNDGSKKADTRAKAVLAGCPVAPFDNWNMNYMVMF